MKKQVLWILLSAFLIASCQKDISAPSSSVSVAREDSFHNADSKFLGDDKVLTAKDGKLTITDFELKVLRQYPLSSDWSDYAIVDDRLYIISSNFQREVNLTVLDLESLELISSEVLFQTEKLCIDPACIFFDSKFYFTLTEIDGAVNNGDPTKENGLYTIKLYSSSDFEKTEYIKEVLSLKRNLEDLEFLIVENKLALVYEEEIAHSLDSSIYLLSSSEELFDTKTFLLSNGDTEPAKMMKVGREWWFFYSSDASHPGMSYGGSDIYLVKFDSHWKMKKHIKIPSVSSGIHLYDVKYKNGTWSFLYCLNYDTTRDLVIEDFR